MVARWDARKYHINPKTGNPIFVDIDQCPDTEKWALMLCTTDRVASQVVDARIERVTKEIKHSGTDEEIQRRLLGHVTPPFVVPFVKDNVEEYADDE